MEILAILLAGIVGLGLYVMGIYNSLVAMKNKVEESWSDIDTQLKRRYDLLPNLIETVKGYASHEKETFEKITQARNMGMNATNVKDQEAADNMLTGALKSIFALAEAYPDLKANQNFMQLQNTLKEIEENIQMSRRYYNATVRDINTKIESFPSNIVANMFKFEKREFFELENETERQNVKVDFSQK
ncbi:MAG: LemA family protein [Candidatus Gracilibacteria bacterium]|jgi:LemA protein|nr:LemA family protein [Candidatus Gracilibacteria bacterium]